MSSTPNNSCFCPQITPGAEGSIISGTPVTNGPNANLLADTLGVSPLYRQQDSARWQSAATIYQSSRSHSPVPQATSQFPFPLDERENMCLTPQKLSQQLLMQAGLNNIGSPISLEDIASINRKKYRENGEKKDSNAEGGPLELEAIAAVHELSSVVKSISVSEILPRTPELIFVNVKTMEDHSYTLELTMKGWRVASPHTDCMNGDYTQLGLHTKYFDNARQVLDVISPGHLNHFHDVLADRLRQYASSEGETDEVRDFYGVKKYSKFLSNFYHHVGVEHKMKRSV
jgi:hypothetical protein